MKKLTCMSIAVAGALLISAPSSFAAPKEGSKPEVGYMQMEAQTKEGALKRAEVEAIELVAVIEKIDVENRKLSLKGPSGDIVDLSVSPSVKRLAEFKVGDKIVVEHMEALAFEVREPTKEEQANPRKVLGLAEKNDLNLPAGIKAGVVTRTIVEIAKINLETEKVTIKMPEGKMVEMKAKVPANLKRVKVGDKVAVIFAEATAIRLSPYKKG